MPLRVQDFDVLEILGSIGNNRKICRKEDGKMFICRELDFSVVTSQEKEQFESDVQELLKLDHPNVVRYVDWAIDETNGNVFLLMDYYDHVIQLGEMIEGARKDQEFFEEDFIWCVLLQLVLAIQECQRRRGDAAPMLYQDIIPENVFLGDQCAQLGYSGSFGMYPRRITTSRIRDMRRSLELPGLVFFEEENLSWRSRSNSIDEEIQQEARYNSHRRHMSEILALGCVMYELCTLVVPYSINLPPIPDCYSAELGAVITSMLRHNHKRRPSVRDLLNTPKLSLLHRGLQFERRRMKIESGEVKPTILDDIRGRFEKEREENIRNFLVDTFGNNAVQFEQSDYTEAARDR